MGCAAAVLARIIASSSSFASEIRPGIAAMAPIGYRACHAPTHRRRERDDSSTQYSPAPLPLGPFFPLPALPLFLLPSFLASSASATDSIPTPPVIPNSAEPSESICQRLTELFCLSLIRILSWQLWLEPLPQYCRSKVSMAFRSSVWSIRRRAPKLSVLTGSSGQIPSEPAGMSSAGLPACSASVRDDVLPTVASGESDGTRSGAPSLGLRLRSPMPAFSFSSTRDLASRNLAEMYCAIV